MNTFLPYRTFDASAKVLDNKRLGKQRVEAWQIHCSLTVEDYGWKSHPAVKMWAGHEDALIAYGLEVCREWISRGFNDSMFPRFLAKYTNIMWKYPGWLNEEFCASHRSNLLRKDPVWYRQFGWTESLDLPYMWPANRTKRAFSSVG